MTLRRADGTTAAARLDGDEYVLLDDPDVGSLLAREDWREHARRSAGPRGTLVDADPAPVVPRPGKIVCVGLNYRSHILEMGRPLPEHPTLFAKFADALVGPADPVELPPESEAMDWEAELAVVIGGTVRRATPAMAEQAIAGFTVMNDITLRDWQFRTREWLQGKTFEATTPLGPQLVTPDDLPGGTRPSLTISTTVDGRTMQKADTADLVFDPVWLVRYVSAIVTLRPGDIIATGTPGGVGHARTPPVYLAPGQRVVTRIDRIGRLDNQIVSAR
ncbi:fumarylacetoacetate hydrolase family protein [Actinomadura graeca]|nr:fumarylacetoacetate hydrolase family protein [Actinomadura graeca]